MEKRRQKSVFPTSDYLNFIKLNKLKLLEQRSNSIPKIFRSYKFKLISNPEIDEPFQTLDQMNQQTPTKKKLRSRNFEMYYKASVGQPIFDKLKSLHSDQVHVKMKSSLEGKMRKISRLIYEGSQMEIIKRKEEGRSLPKEKYSTRKSIAALITIDKASKEVKFPEINKQRMSGKNASVSNSKDHLPLSVSQQPYPNCNPNSPSIMFSNSFCTKKKVSAKYEHSKIIDTFHDYEKLLREKNMVVNSIPPIRQQMKFDQAMLHPSRNRLKTESYEQSGSVSVDLRQIREDTLEERQSKELIELKILATKKKGSHSKNHKSKGTSSEQVLSFINKASKKKQTDLREERTIYEIKIKKYKEFVIQINFAHNKFMSFQIKDDGVKNQAKYRAYVGKGNNNALIKQFLKRRHWWVIEQDPHKCHFVWSQLKINSVFELQRVVKEQECVRVVNNQTKDMKLKPNKKKTLKEINVNQKNRNKPDMKIGIDKIFDEVDSKIFEHFTEFEFNESINLDYEHKLKHMEKKLSKVTNHQSFKLHNHLEQNYHIGNKKALFYYMRQYCNLVGKNVHDYLPLTFHIKPGTKDKEYQGLLTEIRKREHNLKTTKKGPKNIWIVKPGEVSNRGNGITVVNNIINLNRALKGNEKHPNGTAKTYIVQSYLDRPLLYNRRKFDIRHYMLITSLHGLIKGYWYSEGYIRTSSEEFSLEDLSNSIIHLTNDAIQKDGCEYGEHQQGNKLSYSDLQRYLDNVHPQKKINFYQHIYPRMKEIGTMAIEATFCRLNPKRLQHGFEVLGLDFMVDQDFNVWMIEVNTNPCLEISSPLLGRIIPNMVEQSLRLTLDVLFPPLGHYPNTQKHLFPDYSLDHLKFELVFDEQKDGNRLRELYKSAEEINCGQLDDAEEEFEDEGEELSHQQITSYLQ